MTTPAIEINRLSKSFGTRRKRNTAIDILSLTIIKGEVFGFPPDKTDLYIELTAGVFLNAGLTDY